jgi:hypothetical protein
MNVEDTRLLDRLSVAVQNLAASPAAQIAHLSALGVNDSADELALEFDDVYRVFHTRSATIGIPPSTIEKLTILDDLLQKMSALSQAHLWTWKSLDDSVSWFAIRSSAGDAAGELGAWRGETRT